MIDLLNDPDTNETPKAHCVAMSTYSKGLWTFSTIFKLKTHRGAMHFQLVDQAIFDATVHAMWPLWSEC